MSRRKHDGEQEFGSDSFLDVIANIVGILIILIVVAGVKVARQAEQSAAEAAAAVAASEAAIELTKDTSTETSPTAWPWQQESDVLVKVAESNSNTDDQLRLSIPGLTDATSAPFIASEVPFDFAVSQETTDDAVASEEVEQQLAKLNEELAESLRLSAESETELRQLLDLLEQQKSDESLRSLRLASLQNRQTELTTRVLELQESAIEVDSQTNTLRAALVSNSTRQQYVQDALKDVAQQTLKLREVLDEQDTEPTIATRLNHRLQPVGREVQANEEQLFFHLHDGRISHAPLRILADSASAKMQKRKHYVGSQLVKGKVAICEGFELTYSMSHPLVPAGYRQYPNQRYADYSATVRPTDSIRSEPVDHALRIGSRFRQLVETAQPGSTVTIWLYPSDFKHFRSLREFGHSLDLRVAAEPLKDGDHITLNLGAGGRRTVAQ